MGKVERRRSSKLKAECDWPSADGGLRSEAKYWVRDSRNRDFGLVADRW